MEDLMRDEMLDPPRFRDEGHRVVVTLPVRSTAAPSERAWLRELEQRGSIEPADRVLLVHAARGELLTNRRARELLSTDSVTARQALQRLRDADFLEQRGSRAATAYSLKESLAPPAGLRLSRAQLRDLVLEMADDGPIANADVRARTGLDRIEALGILSDLVRERRLSRVGERRGSRYVRP
jgi:ATP-dependent DNA helicase RecG